MKALIEQYLLDQGTPAEPFSIQFLRFSTNLYKSGDNYILEFPKWHFACPKPVFTSQEIEDSLKSEYTESHIDGIENKYANDAVAKQAKIDELNALSDLDLIKNFTY